MNSNWRFGGLLVIGILTLSVAVACGPDNRKKKFGDFCSEDGDCEGGICYLSACLDPDGDLDGDGLKNGVEKFLLGTDYDKQDTDGDGVDDGTEVGVDIDNPLDTDGDGIIDALESLLMTADPDGDCIPDQFDPENDVYTNDMPLLVSIHCRKPGVCADGEEFIQAFCVDGVPTCGYDEVPGWETIETSCDGLDNDCDGQTDNGLGRAPEPGECPAEGVCIDGADEIAMVCRVGVLSCDLSAVAGYEAIETLCDGLDNDCDGQTDEDLVGGECPIENDHGVCTGTWACAESGGGRECVGQVPSAEVCDGIDNNCDGETDEGLIGDACEIENDWGKCEGLTVCGDDGEPMCGALVPGPDVCDAVDNNCDGQTDEDDICLRTARIQGRVYGLVPVIPVSRNAAAALPPPLEGAVITLATEEDCGGFEPPLAGATYLSDATGTFVVQALPGYYCLFIVAEGFETMRTWMFGIGDGESHPLEVVLFPVETIGPVSACGRVVEANLDQEALAPVSGVRVQALGDPSGDNLGVAMSDAAGFFCLPGLDVSEGDYAVIFRAIQEGFYPGEYYLYRYGAFRSVVEGMGEVPVFEIWLHRIPLNVTECLFEGFEVSETSNGWSTEPVEPDVGWYRLTGMGGPNVYIDECVFMPSDEDCTAGTSGCPICVNETDNKCIPAPGHLPNAFAGDSRMVFGTQRLGNYLHPQAGCGLSEASVSGSLISPWIQTHWVRDLVLVFQSAWEVESHDPRSDMMLVEVQAGFNGSWMPVGSVKPDSLEPSKVPELPLSSGGLDRAPVWKQYEFSLASFVGDSLRVRFRFDSIDGNYNGFRGWMLDDVELKGRGCDLFPSTVE
jgi:hypothetical protein